VNKGGGNQGKPHKKTKKGDTEVRAQKNGDANNGGARGPGALHGSETEKWGTMPVLVGEGELGRTCGRQPVEVETQWEKGRRGWKARNAWGRGGGDGGGGEGGGGEGEGGAGQKKSSGGSGTPRKTIYEGSGKSRKWGRRQFKTNRRARKQTRKIRASTILSRGT